MPYHYVGLHPHRSKHPGNAQLDCKQGRLGTNQGTQCLLDLFVLRVAVDVGQQVKVECGQAGLLNSVHCLAEDGVGRVEVPPHANIVRALAGEAECQLLGPRTKRRSWRDLGDEGALGFQYPGIVARGQHSQHTGQLVSQITFVVESGCEAQCGGTSL